MHPVRPKSALSKNKVGPFELKAKNVTSEQHSDHDLCRQENDKIQAE